MQYVRRRRLQLARELLTTTSLSIGEVAERSGYDDQFHFSRAFKQAHGVNPSAYRQQMSAMLF
jgi:AraC-like DNA-binding protein